MCFSKSSPSPSNALERPDTFSEKVHVATESPAKMQPPHKSCAAAEYPEGYTELLKAYTDTQKSYQITRTSQHIQARVHRIDGRSAGSSMVVLRITPVWPSTEPYGLGFKVKHGGLNADLMDHMTSSLSTPCLPTFMMNEYQQPSDVAPP